MSSKAAPKKKQTAKPQMVVSQVNLLKCPIDPSFAKDLLDSINDGTKTQTLFNDYYGVSNNINHLNNLMTDKKNWVLDDQFKEKNIISNTIKYNDAEAKIIISLLSKQERTAYSKEGDKYSQYKCSIIVGTKNVFSQELYFIAFVGIDETEKQKEALLSLIDRYEAILVNRAFKALNQNKKSDVPDVDLTADIKIKKVMNKKDPTAKPISFEIGVMAIAGVLSYKIYKFCQWKASQNNLENDPDDEEAQELQPWNQNYDNTNVNDNQANDEEEEEKTNSEGDGDIASDSTKVADATDVTDTSELASIATGTDEAATTITETGIGIYVSWILLIAGAILTAAAIIEKFQYHFLMIVNLTDQDLVPSIKYTYNAPDKPGSGSLDKIIINKMSDTSENNLFYNPDNNTMEDVPEIFHYSLYMTNAEAASDFSGFAGFNYLVWLENNTKGTKLENIASVINIPYMEDNSIWTLINCQVPNNDYSQILNNNESASELNNVQSVVNGYTSQLTMDTLSGANDDRYYSLLVISNEEGITHLKNWANAKCEPHELLTDTNEY